MSDSMRLCHKLIAPLISEKPASTQTVNLMRRRAAQQRTARFCQHRTTYGDQCRRDHDAGRQDHPLNVDTPCAGVADDDWRNGYQHIPRHMPNIGAQGQASRKERACEFD